MAPSGRLAGYRGSAPRSTSNRHNGGSCDGRLVTTRPGVRQWHGNPRGEALAALRASAIRGVARPSQPTADRRCCTISSAFRPCARVKGGFSFPGLLLAEQLPIRDALWRQSTRGDVLFAAIEHLTPNVRRKPTPDLSATLRHWPARPDNWCHSAATSSLECRP
jgi:hypothetical protein